ncbi:uncharacterized protein SCHCODRAFT_02745269 [Schizophyllum commune H4-8]|uniref:uncharacterized protein n=1 Tax=Schizophyllum commune (strain H4-8 / FGSC 9210) TaxID=578458 RepID=UPI00215E212A|nr:uncharacterized protein SCHCODRAFT_02745269 [Schizophyllum commune H4-8]KAI5896235.1 hypothetical protein SCHCODRAFT_02745269 [Schizophyllum commune H4-8]
MYRTLKLICYVVHLTLGLLETSVLRDLPTAERRNVLAGVAIVAMAVTMIILLSPQIVLQHCDKVQMKIHLSLSEAHEEGWAGESPNTGTVPSISEMRTMRVLTKLDADFLHMRVAIRRLHTYTIPRIILSMTWTGAALRLFFKYRAMLQELKIVFFWYRLRTADMPVASTVTHASLTVAETVASIATSALTA